MADERRAVADLAGAVLDGTPVDWEVAEATSPAVDREAIIGRVELGLSYQELAEALGKPSAEAARKAAERALLRLAEEMKGGAK